MPNDTLTYSNPASMRPDASFMSPEMRGFLFSQDRADYEDQVSLQNLMQQMGAQKAMATHQGGIDAQQAEDRATALTAVPEAQYKTEGLRLGNVATEKGNRALDLKYKQDQLKHAQDQLDRAIEIGAVTLSQGPGGFAAFQQGLQQSGLDPEIQDFFQGVTGPEDFQARLGHLKDARTKTNLEWAKLKADLEKARVAAAATGKPTDWEHYYQRRRAELIRSGMPKAEAEATANRDMADLKVKAGGLALPSPAQRGQEAGATKLQEMAAALEAIAAFTSDEDKKKRYLKDAADLRSRAGGGARQAPGLTKPAAAAAKAVKITNDSEYDKLDSGTKFVGPDGVERVKP